MRLPGIRMVAVLLTIRMGNMLMPSTKHAAFTRTRTSKHILLTILEDKMHLLGLPNGRTDVAAARQ